MKLNVKYHISWSKRPEWLLRFVAETKTTWVKIEEEEVNQVLSSISGILDKTPRKSRTAQSDCKIVPRKINERSIDVFSITGQSLYATIEITDKQ
ncbi:MAG: hypothetical protein RR555_05450 [Bacteroidales bacterium]